MTTYYLLLSVNYNQEQKALNAASAITNYINKNLLSPEIGEGDVLVTKALEDIGGFVVKVSARYISSSDRDAALSQLSNFASAANKSFINDIVVAVHDCPHDGSSLYPCINSEVYSWP